MRRLVVENSDRLDRHVAARPCSEHRGDVSDAKIRGTTCNLGHRVARSVAARDGDIDAVLCVNALGPSSIIHGVLARGDPVGLETHLVLRRRSAAYGCERDSERKSAYADSPRYWFIH